MNVEYVTRQGRFVPLGKGAFGKVFLGRMRRTGQLVAIKLQTLQVSDYRVLLEAAMGTSLSDVTGVARIQGLAIMADNKTYNHLAIISDFIGDPDSFETYTFKQVMHDDYITIMNKSTNK